MDGCDVTGARVDAEMDLAGRLRGDRGGPAAYLGVGGPRWGRPGGFGRVHLALRAAGRLAGPYARAAQLRPRHRPDGLRVAVEQDPARAAEHLGGRLAQLRQNMTETIAAMARG